MATKTFLFFYLMSLGYFPKNSPYLYTLSAQTNTMEPAGQLLHHNRGKRREGYDTLALKAGVPLPLGFEIRGVDKETSHIDEVRLLMVNSNNHSSKTLPATDPRLHAADRNYLILKKGDAYRLYFRTTPALLAGFDRYYIISYGYYESGNRPL